MSERIARIGERREVVREQIWRRSSRLVVDGRIGTDGNNVQSERVM